MAISEREKYLKERDNFQREQDDNRQWHRPQEHVFEAPATGPRGGEASPVTGGTAAGYSFLNTHGEKRFDKDELQTLIQHLQAQFQAIS